MHFSAYVFKSERTVAALLITGLGAKSSGFSVPISLTKIAVLSSIHTSPNQIMIEISEVHSDWVNLSRQGILDFPSSLAALMDPPKYRPVQVPVSLPLSSSNPKGRWIIAGPGTYADLSLSMLSCRIPINNIADFFFLFNFIGLPERDRMYPFRNRIDCESLRQN